MKPKVLVTIRLPQESIERLKHFAEVKLNSASEPLTEDQLRKEVDDVDGIILGLERFDKEVIASASKLKIIARFGVGYENVDINAATNRRIFVTYTPDVLSDAVADLTFALLLSLSRRIVEADRFVKSREWSKGNKFPLGVDLAKKTLGIIGLGRIGMKVLERAISFKMNIIYNSKTPKRKASKYGVELVTLEELLRQSDFVSIHVPSTEDTKGLVGKNELELMKNTAFLINTSRGLIVNQQELYQALMERKIAGAALDVFQEEPLPPNDPILKLSNVVLTPHIGSGTFETRLAMAMMVVDNVLKVLEGKAPINVINKELLTAR